MSLVQVPGGLSTHEGIAGTILVSCPLIIDLLQSGQTWFIYWAPAGESCWPNPLGEMWSFANAVCGLGCLPLPRVSVPVRIGISACGFRTERYG